jgi:L-threonylcarbamoyladenylate synthase
MKLGDLDDLIMVHQGQRIGLLVFQKLHINIDPRYQVILSSQGNIDEAANRLFSSLRMLDSMGVDIILAENVPNLGLGKAINDRLQRAAAH